MTAKGRALLVQVHDDPVTGERITSVFKDPVFLPREQLQSVAEEVHLAIKLLEDGLRVDEEADKEEFVRSFLYYRTEAVIDQLKPALKILAPYMPNYVKPEQEFAEQDLQDSNHATVGMEGLGITETLRNNHDGSWSPVPSATDEARSPEDHGGYDLDGDEREFLSGTDEQSYSERHA